MPAFTNPFKATKRTGAFHESANSRSRRHGRQVSGGVVAPGRVVTKAERSQRASRADSTIPACDGASEEEKRLAEDMDFEYRYSFKALKEKIWTAVESWPPANRLGRLIDDHFAPNVCEGVLANLHHTWRDPDVRSVIVLIMLLLLVFGVLNTTLQYLLSATSVSACGVTTVFMPITHTVTLHTYPSHTSLQAANKVNSGSFNPETYTSTSTETLTSYITVGPVSSSSTLPYVFTVNSAGSTIWVNGVSPSSGVSLVTETTSIYVPPTESTSQAASPSTTTDTIYLTMPTFTTTEFSYASPDTTFTSTSTSTHYITTTVERMDPTSHSPGTFSGMASGGWNASSTATGSASVTTSQPAGPGLTTKGSAIATGGVSQAVAQSQAPGVTKYTSIYYTPASGDPSTSTSTLFLTTTIALQYTTTVIPSGSGYVTTITALPVTITPYGGSMTSGSAIAGADSQSFASSSISPSNASLASATLTSQGSATGLPSGPTFAPSLSPPYNQTSKLPSTLSGVTSSSSPLAYGTLSPLNSSTSAGSASYNTPSALGSASPSYTLANATMTSAASGGMPSITQTISLSSSMAPMLSTVGFNSTVSGRHHKTSVRSHTIGITSTISVAVASTGTPSTSSTKQTKSYHRPQQSPQGYTNSNNGTASMTGGRSITTKRPSHPHSAHSSESTTKRRTRSASLSSNMTGSQVSRNATSASSNTAATRTSSSIITSTTLSPGASPVTASATSSLPGYGSLTSSAKGTATSTVSASSHSHARSWASSSSSKRVYPRPTETSSAASTYAPASSSSQSSGPATPTICARDSYFVLGFDDLPMFLPTENDTAITQAPPIPNPYHNLTFSDGYVYAPEPSEPYPPVSPPHLAVFLSNASGITAKPSSHSFKPGEIGDGSRESNSEFWFDAFSAWFGCDNPGPKVCTLVFSAYTWSAATQDEALTFQNNATVQPCRHFRNCHLEQIVFPSSFRGLTGLQMQAFVDEQPRMFFIDDLAMAWSNNTVQC